MNKDLYKKLVMLSLVGTLSIAEAETTYAHPYFNQSVTYEMVPTVVAISNVEIRNTFDFKSQVIGYLCQGQSATLIADYGNFYQINYNGVICYVDKRFVYESNQVVMTSPIIRTAYTYEDTILYSDYGSKTSICVIPKDRVVDVYSDDNTLLFVKYGNQVGYIEKTRTEEHHHDHDHRYDWPKPPYRDPHFEDNMSYLGGSRYFNEGTGKYEYPDDYPKHKRIKK